MIKNYTVSITAVDMFGLIIIKTFIVDTLPVDGREVGFFRRGINRYHVFVSDKTGTITSEKIKVLLKRLDYLNRNNAL